MERIKWSRLTIGMCLAAALLTGCEGEGGGLGGQEKLSSSPTEATAVLSEPVQTPPQSEPSAELETGGIDQDETTAGENVLDADGTYSSVEDVALYLHTYGELPDNFITKNEARDLGWSGGGLEEYAPGMCIGGDRFGNREGLLPSGTYYECDIDTLGAETRGAKRLVWDEEGNIYYTSDHYESFELLYDAD